jgi:hypothetical protein
MREWYYSESGQMYGPLPEDQIRKMIWDRQLTEDTLVWCGEPDFAERGWVCLADTELSSTIPINDDSFLNSSPTITSAPYYENMKNAQTATNYVFSSNRQFAPRVSSRFISRHLEKKLVIGAISICIVLMLATVAGIPFWYVKQQANAKIMPRSAEELKGKNYQDVITRLKAAGFTNIRTEIVDDLVTGWLVKDGEVERVSANGRANFDSGSRFPIDAKIVVTYHTFSRK